LEEATLEDLEQMLARRAPLLDELARVDQGALSEQERGRLADAIIALREFDARVLERLAERKAEMEHAEAVLAQAKTLARAYRAEPAEPSGVTLRRA
jgi:hypothetical protein